MCQARNVLAPNCNVLQGSAYGLKRNPWKYPRYSSAGCHNTCHSPAFLLTCSSSSSPCLTHRLEGRFPCRPLHIFGGHISICSANKSKLWSSLHPMFPLPQRMARGTLATRKDFTGDGAILCTTRFKAEGTLSQVKIRATGELPYFKMDTLPVNIPSAYPLPPLTINYHSDKQNPHNYEVLKLTGASVRSWVACSFTPLLLSILLRFIKILLLISILFAIAEKALSSEDNWREAKMRIKQWQ